MTAMAEMIPNPEHLSARERQIAEAYAAGQSYREIAERLFIAPATVRASEHDLSKAEGFHRDPAALGARRHRRWHGRALGRRGAGVIQAAAATARG